MRAQGRPERYADRARPGGELALAFGWLETDRIMPGIQAELEAVTAQFDPGHALGTVLGTVNGNQTLQSEQRLTTGRERSHRRHPPCSTPVSR
jgi:hypothetical protein